ncbi:AAA family ATPase [Verrucomicrobiales bacterium BCK34]|nr:AAA family ATPase [Verrucomicrobiales bacterium BCK34]
MNERITPLELVDPSDVEKPKPPFREVLNSAALKGVDFLNLEIPERPRLVGDWFREGDLGFIFAPRGVGKTWLAHLLVTHLTRGDDLDDWEVPESKHVCLLDGEMPPGDVQDRLKSLGVKGENLTILSHQFLFDEGARSFQLGDTEQRTALLDFCVDNKVEVLVIDNLSSVSNISENDNDEWPALGDWLLDFRRLNIAVIVIHHAGRNGQMRGCSRREDPAFWIIRLDDSRERTGTDTGARFVTSFVKNRNAPHWPTPTDWHVSPTETGGLQIETQVADNKALVLQAIKDGLESCGEIAKELDMSAGNVSKIAKALESNGEITINNRRYKAR